MATARRKSGALWQGKGWTPRILVSRTVAVQQGSWDAGRVYSVGVYGRVRRPVLVEGGVNERLLGSSVYRGRW
jgi:hypothetical protein